MTYVVKGVLGAVAVTALLQPADANFCSVFRRHPCAPSYCSPFAHRPCRPFYGFPLGENLQLTIVSNTDAAPVHPDQQDADHDGDDAASAHDVDTIRAMFATLRACWQPPETEAREGMQMSVRFSFTRDGNLKGPPRVTYVSPGVTPEARQVYEQAIKDTLDRCTPMQFSKGMGGAIAGRPIAIRFIDNRTPRPSEGHP
ncbi:MAG: hypothetical protein J2P54_09860 [Bradyrhizobiaceae bacterium]|nr:hypothetical protein [Bradyrhizobiaceae bacterium]